MVLNSESVSIVAAIRPLAVEAEELHAEMFAFILRIILKLQLLLIAALVFFLPLSQLLPLFIHLIT